jgi:nucleoside-diphosphate-sugar epimerase
MHILLTGATGFIGREVVKRLAGQNDTVRILVRPETLARSGHIRQLDGVEVVPGTMTDADVLVKAHQGVDVVYHLAWYWRHSNPEGQEESTQINQEAMEHILRACAKHKVRRLVYTSSVAVYGPAFDIAQWPLTEETPLYQGSYGGAILQNYVQPKIAIENMIRQAVRKYGFEYVILRPSIVYGVGWHGPKRLVQQALYGGQAWRGGSQVGWQMIHVRDLADAIVLAGRRPGAARREFNIAGPEVVTSGEIIRLIRAALGIARWLGRLEPFLRRRRRYQRYDITKAQIVLGFTPRVTLAEGLTELVTATASGSNRASTLSHQAEIAGEMYDRQLDFNILDDYFGHSDFWNWGYWNGNRTTNQHEAC